MTATRAPRHRPGSAGLIVIVAVLGFVLTPPGRAVENAARNPLDEECRYGITLALGGEAAMAESVFVSLLSHSPKDARALNNLGNVALLKGEAAVAFSFYSRAAEADTSDPGILLNQATALMLLGEEDDAVAAATGGVSRAGGPASAADLLGLLGAGDATDRQKGERKLLSREEALRLLNIAAGRVPADSMRAPFGPDSGNRKPAPVWRLAGPRAGDAFESPAIVYWKR